MGSSELQIHCPSRASQLLQVACFSSARRCLSALRRWVATVFHNIHTQFPYALANFSRFGKHCCYVAFRKFHCSPNRYQFRTLFLTYVPGGAPYPSGHPLLLLCSASFLALALVFVLSVALLRPVSSILLSFAGDASLSVDLLALRSHLLLIFYRSYSLVAALARRNSRDPTLSVLRSLPRVTGRARGGLDEAGDVSLRCR